MKNLFLLFFISIKVLAQSHQDFSKSSIQSSASWIDVDYVGDGIIGHKLDVFLPKEGKGPFPVVITVYGSAWFSNSSKAAVFQEGLGQYLLKNGFAVVSVNHRSSKDALWPAQIHDIKAAIRFVRANASAFSLNTSFVGITGYSSGGHLSAMAGATNHKKSDTIHGFPIDLEGSLGKALQYSSHVDAVVDWFGPTDFLRMDECGSSFSHNDAKSPESSLIGGAIQENKEKVALANPLNYITQSTPPFLVIHGNKDPLVPHCESEKLVEVLQKQDVTHQLIIVDGGAHGPGVMIDTYYAKMIAFFKNHSK